MILIFSSFFSYIITNKNTSIYSTTMDELVFTIPKIILPEGATYLGTLLNGKPDGFGKMTYKDGTIYEGNFKEMSPEGEGICTFPNGHRIIGNFSKGNMIGLGKCININDQNPSSSSSNSESNELPLSLDKKRKHEDFSDSNEECSICTSNVGSGHGKYSGHKGRHFLLSSHNKGKKVMQQNDSMPNHVLTSCFTRKENDADEISNYEEENIFDEEKNDTSSKLMKKYSKECSICTNVVGSGHGKMKGHYGPHKKSIFSIIG